jgi:hypothetical protein
VLPGRAFDAAAVGDRLAVAGSFAARRGVARGLAWLRPLDGGIIGLAAPLRFVGEPAGDPYVGRLVPSPAGLIGVGGFERIAARPAAHGMGLLTGSASWPPPDSGLEWRGSGGLILANDFSGPAIAAGGRLVAGDAQSVFVLPLPR